MQGAAALLASLPLLWVPGGSVGKDLRAVQETQADVGSILTCPSVQGEGPPLRIHTKSLNPDPSPLWEIGSQKLDKGAK